MSLRSAFVALVLNQMHAPYRWNGKGERDNGTGPRVFDCSGLVTWAFHEVTGVDWRATANTDVLLAKLDAVSEAELLPGDLVLYGKPTDADHVMVHVGGGVVVGASGGGRTTLTLADATRKGASVKAFASVRYRRDVIGFRRLPFRS